MTAPEVRCADEMLRVQGVGATRVELLAALHDEARKYYGDTTIRFVRVEVRTAAATGSFVGSALAMRREARP